MTSSSNSVSDQPIVLETHKRLSESITWEILRDYHSKRGVSAFEVVPYKVTNNCLFVSMMTDLLLASMNDHEDIIDTQYVQQILELGSGSGCFGFRLMSQLERKKNRFEKFRNLKVKYSMTDFADSNVEAWRIHPAMQTLVEAGLIEFDTLNINTELDKKVTQNHNPLIVIANYLIDDLHHDGFFVENGKVLECLYSAQYSCSQDDAEKLPKPGNLSWNIRNVEITEDSFADKTVYEVLKSYEDQEGFGFALPVGAFRLIQQLRQLTDENFVFIGADWGSTTLWSKTPITPTIHGGETGSLSVSVNFDALKKYVTLIGGNCEIAEVFGLKIFVITMIKNSRRQDHVMFELHERIAAENPPGLFSFMCEMIASSPEQIPVVGLLVRCLKSCHYEPEILLLFVDRFFDRLIQAIEKLNAADAVILNEVLAKVLQNVYSVSGVSIDSTLTSDPAANLIKVWKAAQTANFAQDARNTIVRNAYIN